MSEWDYSADEADAAFDRWIAALRTGRPEQAHTPTDDEREAPASTSEVAAIIDRAMRPWGLSNIGTHTAARALVAAGFRRTVQGEPTDAQVLAALNAHYRVRLAQSEPMPGDPEVEGDAHSLDEYSSKSIDRMRAALRAANGTGANLLAEQGEVEWEYGVTTKWGIHEHPHLEGAERYAAAVRDEIENGRASGDLKYHGRVMKRTKAKVGRWVPVNENGENDD